MEIETMTESLDRCILCGSKNLAPFISSFSKCRSCDIVFLSKRVPEKEIGKYYSEEYQPYSSEYNSLTEKFINWRTKREIQLFKRLQPTVRTALEIGCSWGKYLLTLKNRGFDVTGIELTDSIAEKGRGLGLNIKSGTLKEQNLGIFDMVIMSHVIEHLYEPLADLIEINRLLSRGGLFVLKTPNVDSLEVKIFGKFWMGLDIPRHTILFSEKTLIQTLEGLGFSIRYVKHEINPNNFILSLQEIFKYLHSPKWFYRWFNIKNYLLIALFAPISFIFSVLKSSGRIVLIAQK